MADQKPPVIDAVYQDPADVLDYTIDWAAPAKPPLEPFLTGSMTITSHTFAVYGMDWTVSTAAVVTDLGADDTTSTVRVAAVTADVYVTGHVVASDGQEKDRSIKIKLKEQ